MPETGHKVIKGALELDGVNDYVDCGNNESLNLHGKNFTMMAWVYIEESGKNVVILSKELGGAKWPEYALYLAWNSTVQAFFGNANNGSGQNSVTSTMLSARRWHHIATTYDGLNYTMYIDGVETSRTGDLFGSPYAGDSKLFIGAAPRKGVEGFAAVFKGRIAELAIFSRCLLAAEVKICYKEGISSLKPADVIKATPQAGAKSKRNDIIVLYGIDYGDCMIRKALKDYKTGKIIYHNIYLGTGLIPKVKASPKDVITDDELSKAGGFIIVNAPAPGIAPQTRQLLKKHIQDGMNVLIMGGLFSFGKGQYRGTELEEIVPVRIKNQWSVKKLEPPLILQPTVDVSFSKSIDWKQKPAILYYHDVDLKKGTKVWLKAGESPILVVRKMGKGYIAGFLTAPLGNPAQGTLAYWQWEDWPKLLGEIIQKLMEQ